MTTVVLSGAVEMNSLLNLEIFKLYAKLQLQGKNQAVSGISAQECTIDGLAIAN